MKRNLIASCLVTVLVPLAMRADTTNLPVVADTFLISSSPGNNAGGTGWVDGGTDGGGGVRRGLLRFDLSALPAQATVSSATLVMIVTNVPGFAPANSTFSLYRLNAGWVEGNKTGSPSIGSGSPASPGEATWNERIAGTTGWTSPGATADAAATASASTPVGTARTPYTWSGAGLLADVEFWRSNPASNFGWLLRSDDELTTRTVRGFISKEVGQGAPVLQIEYSMPTPTNVPPVVSIFNPTNGAVFLSPATVAIEANATDADGSVTNVEFLDGLVSLGSVASKPYKVTVDLLPGSHSLAAVARDDKGASSTSVAVSILVTNPVISNPIAQRIPKGTIIVELQTVAAGMASPLGMAVPDDGSGRMFVYDQDGRVYVVAGGSTLPNPLLDLRSRLVTLAAYDERGLLGLAAHPNFAQNPFIYTYTSEPVSGPADFQTGVTNNHQSVITEWRISAADTNVVDVSSRREVMRIDQPQSNHNGGTMRFGPDGNLYVTLGDGGQANDVGAGHVAGGNAQDTSRIWGKVIRISVDGRNSSNGQYGIPSDNPFLAGGGLPEIFAYGVRNPFAFSFDRTSGQLFLADVGQNKVEEVDIVTKGGNYGWNLREGAFWFDSSSGSVVAGPVRPAPSGMIDPIAQYDHDDGSAVIGGYVYRGAALPELTGRYVFGDWGSFGAPSGRLYYLDATNGVNELQIGLDDRTLSLWLKGFGEGPDGELYVFGSRWLGPSGKTGKMLKIVAVPERLALNAPARAAGSNLVSSWTGGNGPFALQKKDALLDPVWLNHAVTGQRSATASMSRGNGFFRVTDAGRLPTIPFSTYMTGAAERPTTNNSAGIGNGIFLLDGNTLTFSIRYSGLTTPAFMGHIHGPAPASGSGGVLIDLDPFKGTGWSTNGTISGVLLLTDAQKAYLLAGQTYVNLHTATYGAGEIRGQIAPVNMLASLSGANEASPVATEGTGLANLMLVGNQLTLNVTYGKLSAAATASHIHGPAPQGQNGPVLVGLDALNGGGYSTSGALSGTVQLSPDQLAAVVDGVTYINFHTSTKPSGEIRGQILPEVTGVPLTTLLSGLAEKPAPLTNSANGNAGFSLAGNVLTFNVTYGGLSGPATAAHIHGVTNTGANAGVLIDLAPFNGGAFGTSGTLSGSVSLSNPQRDAVLAGLTYVNFHTASNPAGEMRGQIAPVGMVAGLSGLNERPTPVSTPGSGQGALALVRDRLNLVVVYGGLTGTASASHIHGPAGLTGSAGVLIDLQPFNGGAYGDSGSLHGQVSLSVPQMLSLIDGQTYINFHTAANGGGEIRGQIMR